MTQREDQRRSVQPADEPVTARDEAPEPAGEEQADNEAERISRDAAGPDAPAQPGAGAEPEDDRLARAERERDEYLELARRTQAAFENYRKRAAKEAAGAGERAKGGFVQELLPVVDNLERALDTATEAESHLAEGVRMVHAELLAALERNGVEQFDPKGEQFDPAFHEALSTREQDGAQPGVVLDVVERGYRRGDMMLRPARVVVSG